VWRHAELGPIASPWDFAAAAGAEPQQVAKTVLVADRGRRSAARLAALPAAVAVTVWRHAELGPIASPWDFAAAAGAEPRQVAKTVLVADRGRRSAARLAAPEGAYAAAVLSFCRRIALQPLAAAMGWSGCEMARREELEAVTGYPRLGVSPLGLPCPVFVDEDLLALPAVFIGAGTAGVELELEPRALVAALKVSPLAIAV
jgi:Cys-tRNA(Pro)/Cys-tRNA(Cys) deacylase